MLNRPLDAKYRYAPASLSATPSMYFLARSASFKSRQWLRHSPEARALYTYSCSSAVCSSESRQQLDNQSSGNQAWQQPLLTLERSVGARSGADKQLWETGAFAAGVVPDLPVAASWAEWAARIWHRHTDTPEAAPQHGNQKAANSSRTVKTVACQVRSRQQLQQRLRAAAGVGTGGQPPETGFPADAVLIVSGSHPAHSLAAALGRTPDSFELLQAAAAMRKQGSLPQSLGLWAVENPLLNRASRLERKVHAGAEVVLTQPPLLWEQFDAWITDAHRRGLTEQAQVVIGVPMLTSVGNLQFWLHLCRATHADGAAALVREFRAHEAEGKEALLDFCASYNRHLVEKVLSTPGVAGLHIMPLSKVARQQVQQMLQDGILPDR